MKNFVLKSKIWLIATLLIVCVGVIFLSVFGFNNTTDYSKGYELTVGLDQQDDDISKVYESYEKILHENYVDSQDLLASLADKIEMCTYFDGAQIYIDEFTGFTPNQYKVIRSLLCKASEVNITLTLDNKLVKTYNKTDIFSRTKFTEEKLKKLCLEAGVPIKPEISLNSTKIKRFNGNEELEHLEKN